MSRFCGKQSVSLPFQSSHSMRTDGFYKSQLVTSSAFRQPHNFQERPLGNSDICQHRSSLRATALPTWTRLIGSGKHSFYCYLVRLLLRIHVDTLSHQTCKRTSLVVATLPVYSLCFYQFGILATFGYSPRVRRETRYECSFIPGAPIPSGLIPGSRLH